MLNFRRKNNFLNVSEKQIKLNTLKYFKEIVKMIKMSDKKYSKLYKDGLYTFSLDIWQTEFLNDNPELKATYENLNSKKYYKVHNTDLIVSLDLLLSLFNEANIVYKDVELFMGDVDISKGYFINYSINRKESLNNISQNSGQEIRRAR